MENPYRAPNEIVRAELVKPARQFPPLGYMFIAAVMLQGTFATAWFGIPPLVSDNELGSAAALAVMCGVSFLIAALAMRPVWRWFSTGRYH